jgi:hypothetical protein
MHAPVAERTATARLRTQIEAHWTATVVLVVAAALLVRLAVIAVSGGGDDLRVYVYFARLALAGRNPYEPPADGPISPDQAVNLPGEQLLFAGLLKLHDSPDTLRVVFALADAATIALIGSWHERSTAWRLALMTFYGFSPFVLYSWTGHAEDKTLLFLGITGLLIALERARYGAAWAITGALAVFKWVGAFWAPVLALDTLRARGARYAAVVVGLFLLVFGLSHLPWLPASLDAYDLRSSRTNLDPPLHAALLKPLADVGLYAPWMVKVGTPLALAAVFVAYARRSIGVAAAVVLSQLAAYVFLPDESDNRILLIALPMLYVIRLTPARMVVLWAISLLATAALVFQLDGVPHGPGALHDAFQRVLGAYGSTQHVVVMNLILVAVLVWFVLDARRGSARATATRAA